MLVVSGIMSHIYFQQTTCYSQKCVATELPLLFQLPLSLLLREIEPGQLC